MFWIHYAFKQWNFHIAVNLFAYGENSRQKNLNCTTHTSAVWLRKNFTVAQVMPHIFYHVPIERSNNFAVIICIWLHFTVDDFIFVKSPFANCKAIFVIREIWMFLNEETRGVLLYFPRTSHLPITLSRDNNIPHKISPYLAEAPAGSATVYVRVFIFFAVITTTFAAGNSLWNVPFLFFKELLTKTALHKSHNAVVELFSLESYPRGPSHKRIINTIRSRCSCCGW